MLLHVCVRRVRLPCVESIEIGTSRRTKKRRLVSSAPPPLRIVRAAPPNNTFNLRRRRSCVRRSTHKGPNLNDARGLFPYPTDGTRPPLSSAQRPRRTYPPRPSIGSRGFFVFRCFVSIYILIVQR